MFLFAEGWDKYNGDSTQAGRNWTTPITLSSSHPKSGTYGYGGGSGQANSRAISPLSSTIFFSIWTYYITGNQPSQSGILFGLVSGSFYDGFNAQAGINITTDNKLTITRGFNPGTTLETSSAVLNSNALNYITGKIEVADSGSWVVKCNGSTVLSGSGDTQSQSSATIGGVNIGNNGSTFHDDLVVWDSSGASPWNNFFSDNLIVLGSPAQAGNGALTDWTPSSGSDHGAMVDDATANDDTDYNSESTPGDRDSYTFDLSVINVRTKYAVQVAICTKATSAGTNLINGLYRDSGGTVSIGIPKSVPTSYDYIEQAFYDSMFS